MVAWECLCSAGLVAEVLFSKTGHVNLVVIWLRPKEPVSAKQKVIPQPMHAWYPIYAWYPYHEHHSSSWPSNAFSAKFGVNTRVFLLACPQRG